MVISLLILVIVTLLAVSMFKGYGLQQKIAGNTMDKTRSFEASQGALQFGEWWIGLGAAGTGSACATLVTVLTPANMMTCSNALANPTQTPWTVGLSYTPPLMMVASGGHTATDSASLSDINYSSAPSIYIQFLGLSASQTQLIYQVTSAGYGGNANAVSVVQSIYATQSNVKPIDGQ